MTDTVKRFSNRVENYIKYRPTYPKQVLELFKTGMGLTPQTVMADIGSGPGISARMFLENGNTVYCVEPNDAMRAAAEQLIGGFQGFKSVNGTAENTTLPDNSIDIVISAQAFHWFDPEKTRPEFERIIKSGGFAALIWNIRQLEGTPFLVEYEQFLIDNANDYGAVRHDNITEDEIAAFFNQGYKKATFENEQIFDFAGLRGRMFSSSYMPAENSERGQEVEEKLRILFDKHAENGKIKVPYDTNVFYSNF
jgi:SAM-dependent methyltransferase